MSNSIQSVQAANAQTQIESTVQPPKKAPAQNSIPQDTVTISKSSQQANAGNTNTVARGAENGDKS